MLAVRHFKYKLFSLRIINNSPIHPSLPNLTIVNIYCTVSQVVGHYYSITILMIWEGQVVQYTGREYCYLIELMTGNILLIIVTNTYYTIYKGIILDCFAKIVNLTFLAQ